MIYNGESDNVCHSGQGTDMINLIININDRQTIKRVIDGFTICDTYYIRYANAIHAVDSMSIVEFDQNMERSLFVSFKQEPTKKYAFGLLSQIYQKATVKNPVTIFSKPHTCTVLGDGKIQHFGIWFSTDPAEIYLRCLSSQSEEKTNLVSHD